jgi:hypothetical protein
VHPDLTIAVARDRHLRRTAAIEARAGHLRSRDAVWRPPIVGPIPVPPVPPVRLRVIAGGRLSSARATGTRPAA